MGFEQGNILRQKLRLLLQLRYSCILPGLVGLCLLGLITLTGCAPDRQEQGVIHLTFWQGVNPPPNRVVLESLIDHFNQSHPQIQVDSFYIGQPDQQMPKILAAVVGNAPPDLLWYNPTITGQLVDLGALRPLEDWWQASRVRSQTDPALLSTMSYQGHIWSVPFGTNNIGVFYRPSLFKAAGITQLPQTWAELRQAAAQLTRDSNGDGRADQHGLFLSLGQGDFAVFTWLPFMWSAGGELSNQDLQSVNLVNGGAIAALQLWSDLLKDGSAILSLPERGYELDNFLNGKVAMQVTGPWTLAQLQSSGVDFGVFPIPEDVKPATGLGGENLFVLQTNPEREQAALVFAEYVLSQEFQTTWALKTGYLPVNLLARQSEAYQQFVAQQPSLEVFLEQMAVARSRPLFAGYNRVSENLGRALESVLLQKSSPEEALKQAQARLEAIAGS
jgi:multiple sugar transport system substrate-binding protein